MHKSPQPPTIEKMDNTTRDNKGYGLNQGGFNSYSGFRGRHRYLKTMQKAPEPEVKKNNTLHDDKKQPAEKMEEKQDPDTTKY